MAVITSRLVRAAPGKFRALALLPLACGPLLGTAAEQGPAVSLFPTSVRENIRFTQETAAAMENSLQDIIRDLDTQMQSFENSKCQGASGDPGCEQIKANIARTFKTMLEQLEASLPDMERAVRQTNHGLGARLKNEIGLKMTPRDLQEELLRQQATTGVDTTGRPKRRSRMSENFKRYYELVRTQGSQDLVTLAAEIYLDTEESLRFIELTRAEIDTALVSIELDQFFGDVTPEMVGTLNGVKALLFGESPEEPEIIGDPPPPEEEPAFKSPWEI